MDLQKRLAKLQQRAAELEARIVQERAETGAIVARFLEELRMANPLLAEDVFTLIDKLPLTQSERRRVQKLILPERTLSQLENSRVEVDK